jgi:four helix bundle protein
VNAKRETQNRQREGKTMENRLAFARRMQERTLRFAVNVVRFFARLPKTDEARVSGRQFLRAGTSVAANHRAVCRAKSNADFISKMGTVVEEADESVFWIELMENAGVCAAGSIQPLKTEANELLRIFSTSLNTAKRNSGRQMPIH